MTNAEPFFMNRRSLLKQGLAAAGGVGLLASGLPACADSPEGPGGTGAGGAAGKNGFTIGLTYVPNVQFCAFYLAEQEGLFGSLEVTLRHHGEQEGLFEALRLGREDLVFASADEAMVAGGLETVATAYQSHPARIVLPGAGRQLADLSGLSLGIPGRFGSSYFAALLALQSAGLTENDVQLVEIGYTTVSAITTGAVDAVVGFANNDVVQLEQQDFDLTALSVAPAETLVGPSLIAMPEDVDDPRIATVIEAMAEAERRIAADPDLGLDATATYVPALADPEQRANAAEVLDATIGLWKDASGNVSTAVDDAAMGRMEKFLTAAGLGPKAGASDDGQ